MSEDSQVLMAEAILGEDAEKFLKSDIGEYLTGRIEQDIEDAKAGLVDVDPMDSVAVMKLQNDIKRAESIKQYLSEIVVAGRNAYELLHGNED